MVRVVENAYVIYSLFKKIAVGLFYVVLKVSYFIVEINQDLFLVSNLGIQGNNMPEFSRCCWIFVFLFGISFQLT